MDCTLCHQHVDLWDLDGEGVGGLPAHRTCADAYRSERDAALAECEALIMGEPDRRKHRHRLDPAA